MVTVKLVQLTLSHQQTVGAVQLLFKLLNNVEIINYGMKQNQLVEDQHVEQMRGSYLMEHAKSVGGGQDHNKMVCNAILIHVLRTKSF